MHTRKTASVLKKFLDETILQLERIAYKDLTTEEDCLTLLRIELPGLYERFLACLPLVCTGRLTYVKRHSGPYSHVQKIGKLSSVAPVEQCNDTLRICRNHVHVQKPWKVHVNIIVSPVIFTDFHDHLYRYGSFPYW